MKKIIILILMIFAITGVKSQNQWSFGPRVGVGFSRNSLDYKYCSNVVGGVFGEYKIKKFATELDILYTKQGCSFREYKCILIPLKFKFYPWINYGMNIFLGPQLDIYTEEPVIPIPGGSEFDYKKTSASITAGLGYRFKFGLDISFNYNHGLVNLNKDKSSYEKNRVRVFQITAAYDLFKLFNIRSK